MKRLFSLMLVGLMVVSASAQSEHVTFKGKPLCGKLNDFVTFLVAEGYKKGETTPTAAYLEGSFAGYDDCTILVCATAKTKEVWKVAVYLPLQSSWYTLENRYKDIKARYTEKYGRPSDDYEFKA